MSKPNTSTASQPSSYSPPGCNKPVMTYLNQPEIDRLKKLAATEMRSQAAMVRMLIIEGMERYKNKTE